MSRPSETYLLVQIRRQAKRLYGDDFYFMSNRMNGNIIMVGTANREIKVHESERIYALQTMLRCLKAQP